MTELPRKSQTYNPPNVPAPQPQFSQVNTFTFSPGDTLVAVTGQLAIPPPNNNNNPNNPEAEEQSTPQNFEDQVRLALSNLENCLQAVGARKRDIFKVTHHVVDFDPVKQNPSQVFIEWLEKDGDGDGDGDDVGGFRPASAMLPAWRLAGEEWKYE